MTKRIFIYLIPVLFLAASTFVFTSSNFQKQPRSQTDDVLFFMSQLQSQISQGQWDQAVDSVNKLDGAWKQVVARAQFSVERDDVVGFERTLYRLRGSIVAQDQGISTTELAELRYHFDSLGQ